MQILLGKNLKALRTSRGLTQEEVAAHLGISFQSVSKWERCDGYPDITMLPALAAYFGVTVDHLLGTDELAMAEVYDLRNRKWIENNRTGLHRENIELMRSSLRDFPNDPLLLVQLSTSLEKAGETEAERRENLRQSIAVQEQILRYCEDCEVRSATLFNICFSYRKNGEHEKALATARKLPNLYKGRENALICFLSGKEKREVAKAALEPLAWSLVHHLTALAEVEGSTAYIEKAGRLLELLADDLDASFADKLRSKLK